MFDRNNQSPAEIADGFLRRTAIAVMLVSLAMGLRLIEHWASEDIWNMLNIIQRVLAILIVLIIIPGLFRFKKLRQAEKNCTQSDSYIAAMYQKAGMAAFNVIILSLIALAMVPKRFWADLPVDFTLDLMMAISFGAFGIAFFYLTRPDGDEGNGDEWDDSKSLDERADM